MRQPGIVQSNKLFPHAAIVHTINITAAGCLLYNHRRIACTAALLLWLLGGGAVSA